MANIQSKNIVHLNQIKLRRTHKISRNKTILKLEKNKRLCRRFLKKAIVLATNKLEKFKEEGSDIITRVIAETIVKIFELQEVMEAPTGNNFLKRFAIQIWKKIA